MLTEIEENITARLTEKLTGASRVAIDEAHAVNTLKLPGVDVIVAGGSFTRVAQTYKVTPQVFVIVTFQNLRSTQDRRKGVYPIIESILALLIGQTLDLAIEGLRPKRLDNITTEQEADEGKIIFQIEFETGFVITAINDEAIVDLLTIGLNYYLQDPADDEVADASDLVALDQT